MIFDDFLGILKLKKHVLVFFIAVMLFYVTIVILSDANQLITKLKTVNINFYAIVFPLVIINIIITGWRYQIILKSIDIQLSLRQSVIIFTSGLSMLVTPGGSGTAIRSYILKKSIGKSISKTLPIFIFERWIELLAITMIIGLLLMWVNIPEAIIIFLLSIVVLVFSLLVFRSEKAFGYLESVIKKFNFLKKLQINLDESRKSSKVLFHQSLIIKTLPITLLTKIIQLFIVFLIVRSFDVDLDILTAGQIYYVPIVAGALSFIPGGLVITEAGIYGLLIKYGLEMSIASLLVISIRFVTMWFPVILGFLTLKLALKSHQENQN